MTVQDDHRGAEIAEQAPGEEAELTREIENANAVEVAAHGRAAADASGAVVRLSRRGAMG